MHVLTSKRAPNSAYGQVVARSVDTQIGVSAASVGDSPFANRHVEGLRSLRDLLQSLSGDDPRVFALWTCQNRGGGDSDAFEPGEEQQVFLSSLGLTGDLDSQLPDAGELLSEFVALGCCDGFDRQQAVINRLPDDAARAAQAEVTTYRERAEATETLNATLNAELESARSEAGALGAQVESLRRLLPGVGNGSDPAPEKAPVKRAKKKKPAAATAGGK